MGTTWRITTTTWPACYFSRERGAAFVAEAVATTDPTIAATTLRADATCGAPTVDARGWASSRSGERSEQDGHPKVTATENRRNQDDRHDPLLFFSFPYAAASNEARSRSGNCETTVTWLRETPTLTRDVKEVTPSRDARQATGPFFFFFCVCFTISRDGLVSREFTRKPQCALV